MHVDYEKIENNRQILHQLQIAFCSNFALNEVVKVVKNVTQCKIVKNVTHNVINEKFNINV